MSNMAASVFVIVSIVGSLHLHLIYSLLRKAYLMIPFQRNGVEALRRPMGGLWFQTAWQYTWTLVLLVVWYAGL